MIDFEVFCAADSKRGQLSHTSFNQHVTEQETGNRWDSYWLSLLLMDIYNDFHGMIYYLRDALRFFLADFFVCFQVLLNFVISSVTDLLLFLGLPGFRFPSGAFGIPFCGLTLGAYFFMYVLSKSISFCWYLAWCCVGLLLINSLFVILCCHLISGIYLRHIVHECLES